MLTAASGGGSSPDGSAAVSPPVVATIRSTVTGTPANRVAMSPRRPASCADASVASVCEMTRERCAPGASASARRTPSVAVPESHPGMPAPSATARATMTRSAANRFVRRRNRASRTVPNRGSPVAWVTRPCATVRAYRRGWCPITWTS